MVGLRETALACLLFSCFAPLREKDKEVVVGLREAALASLLVILLRALALKKIKGVVEM